MADRGNISKIEKRMPYREEIKAMIMNAIVDGTLKPGDRIVETRWAKELGVSQSPIREALRELEMIGLVETIPYRGCLVCEITNTDLIDGMKVRSALEVLAAEEVIKMNDYSFIEEMEEMLGNMNESALKGDVMAFTNYDVRFHESLIEATGNRMLERLWNQCHALDSTHMITLLSKSTYVELSDRHQVILDLLRSENREEKIDKIFEAIREHFYVLIEELMTLEKQEKTEAK